MRPLVSRLILVVFVGMSLACQKSGPSSKEIREFEELERALGTLAEAPREDRDIRLQEVAELKTQSDRVRKVKDLCVESYRLFGEVSEVLRGAKKQTNETELKLAEAKQRKQDGKELLPEEEKKLFKMSQSASAALKDVTEALDRAERAVKSCQDARQVLRKYMSDQ